MQEIVAPETAGDPTCEQACVRSSPRTLSRRLREAGHAARPPPVGRLLTTGGDARHVNAMTSEARAHHPDRTAQFDYSARQRQTFAAAGLPISSVDTTKKELIGGLHEQRTGLHE